MNGNVRKKAVRALGEAIPLLGASTATGLLIDRIAWLIEAGEMPGPLLARLNPPAIVERCWSEQQDVPEGRATEAMFR